MLAVEDILGYGAGVQMLLVGPRPQPVAKQADEDLWAEIALAALPGVLLVEVNEYDLPQELSR